MTYEGTFGFSNIGKSKIKHKHKRHLSRCASIIFPI